MSNATQSVAAARINSLLDANSFVEIGQAVTAWYMYTARMHLY